MVPVLRFAPSPTGKIHVGNLRAALLNFLFARKNNAKFILRIDDTDTERSKQEYIDQIKQDLEWLGVLWDETFSQSARINEYENAIKILKERGFVYKCYETKEELDIKRKIQLSKKKPPVYDRSALKLTDEDHETLRKAETPYYWRFKLNQKPLKWHDMIHGDLLIDTASISDPIVKKSDGGFVYLLASVVDDIDSGVTHIIRGDDHIANTALQIQMIEALTGKPNTIEFGHYPLLQSMDGDEFSKRNNSLSIEWFKETGLEPMSLISILAKLGSSDSITPCTSIDELVETFNLSRISKARPKFDADDVIKMNRKILSRLSFDEVKPRVSSPSFSQEIWDLVKDNISKLLEVDDWCGRLSLGKFEVKLEEEDCEFLALCETLLKEDSNYDTWIKSVESMSGRNKFSLYHPIRMALTGSEKGPELKKLFEFLGINGIKARLKKAANTGS